MNKQDALRVAFPLSEASKGGIPGERSGHSVSFPVSGANVGNLHASQQMPDGPAVLGMTSSDVIPGERNGQRCHSQ